MRRSFTAITAIFIAAGTVTAEARDIRVCADPNNLPFSNAAGEGFENRIVRLLARDLGDKVVDVWRAQRRGLIRDALDAGLCDLLPGVPSAIAGLRNTMPYYRSMYVFVAPATLADIASFDDPRLAKLSIGVQLIGDAGFNAPPAQALARRGRTDRIKGYPIFGDYSRPNPPAAIVDAVAEGAVDIAVAWGPMAGYFAARSTPPLHVEPVSPLSDGPVAPMVFDVSMGVRLNDERLLSDLNAAISRHGAEIRAILDGYGVPQATP